MRIPRLIIFDLDGTLFDTHESIAHCISLTFSALSRPIPAIDAIRSTIASGAGLEDSFRMLSAFDGNSNTADAPNSKIWIDTYRSIYATEGLPLITPFPHAKSILEWLKKEGIVSVVISNKGVKTVEALLEKDQMADLVDLVLGDMPDIPRKPDPDSYVRFVAPKYEGLEPKDVMMVGDTTADIQFAKNIGAMSCWARYGYGVKEHCELLAPDVIIDDLQRLEGLFALRN